MSVVELTSDYSEMVACCAELVGSLLSGGHLVDFMDIEMLLADCPLCLHTPMHSRHINKQSPQSALGSGTLQCMIRHNLDPGDSAPALANVHIPIKTIHLPEQSVFQSDLFHFHDLARPISRVASIVPVKRASFGG